MENDLYSKINCVKSLAPVAIATDTTTALATIDGAGYESIAYAIQSGVITDGAYAVKLFEGDAANMSDEVEVTDSEKLNGSLPSFALSEDGVVKFFGYRGKKRYTRVKIVSSATTSGGLFAALAILGDKAHAS